MFVAGLGHVRDADGRRPLPARAQARHPDRRRRAAPRASTCPGLRSLDEGFVPEILDPSVLDAKYLVSNRDAVAALRDLVALEGVFAGPSSGGGAGRGRARGEADGAPGRSSRSSPTAAGSTSRRARSTGRSTTWRRTLEGGVSWW